MRPLGVSLLAILSAFVGILAIVGAPFVGKAQGIAIGALALVYGILDLVLARGLWKLRLWGWKLGFGVSAAFILFDAAALVLRVGEPVGILRIVANLVVLAYLIFARDRFSAHAEDERPLPVVS